MTDPINNIETPLVSIIIPTYNRAHFLDKAIATSLAQDYPNLEIIISDNCSTDNTENILKTYLSDPRIKYFKNAVNIGMIPNIKIATEERAQGKYFTFVSSDDYLIDDHFISNSIRLINKYPNILLVFGKYNILYEEIGKIESDMADSFNSEYETGTDVFLKFPKIRTLGWAGALMHRDSLIAEQPFQNNVTSADQLANLKLMLKGNVAFINNPVYLFRVHGNCACQSLSLIQHIENFSFINEMYDIAFKKSGISIQKLNIWKDQMSYNVAKNIAVQLAPFSEPYRTFIQYLKNHFPGALKKMKMDIRWNLQIFVIKYPNVALKFLKVISKKKYLLLKYILSNDPLKAS